MTITETSNPFARAARYRLTWFLVMFFCYCGVGLMLSYGHGLVMGDALSRVADARFVLFSRYPHLAAMGFVFTPLTTFAELPLVAIMNPWPGLLSHAVPAIVVSAASMSGAILQIGSMLRDRRTGQVWTVVICATAALHPMMILYAANGMSEAPFVLTMVLCARGLLRWTGSDDVHDLGLVGLALAFGLLVRYDALAVAIACSIFVAATTWWRSAERGRKALSAAAMDVAIVVAPILTVFALWSAVSWLTSGDALAQFTSDYGNSSVLTLSGGAGHSPAYRLVFTIVEWIVLEPMILIIIGIALVLVGIDRALDALSVLVVFGSVLGFQALVFVRGGTFGFLRFAITVIPLAACLVGLLRPRQGVLFSRRAGPAAVLQSSAARLGRVRTVWTRLAVVGLLMPSLVVPVFLMRSPELAPQEYPSVVSLLSATVTPQTRLSAEQQSRTFQTERDVAAYLDSLDLPDGSVACDTLYGFAIVAASQHPKQFVIPSDFDFVNMLNNPAEQGIRYLITVPNSGRGTTDQINRRYPTIYRTGASIATLDLEFPSSGSGQPDYRIYRVLSTSR